MEMGSRPWPRRKLARIAQHAARYAEAEHPKFPWRTRPTVYRTFLAEFFLQRTQAAQVANVYVVFTRRYPSLQRLLKAEREDVLDVLRPLGLCHRTEAFLEARAELETRYRGRLPRTEAGLLSLPGVGRYMARAVCCFALGDRCGILDVNVARVLLRALLGEEAPPKRPGTVRELWDLADAVAAASDDPKMSQWGLLDLGREVCRRKPDCSRCPLRRLCVYRRTHPKC